MPSSDASEDRAAQWLLLLAAGRLDSIESNLRSYFTLRPDKPVTETGVLLEFSHRGLESRVGQQRADVKHHLLDPLIVATPWLARAFRHLHRGQTDRQPDYSFRSSPTRSSSGGPSPTRDIKQIILLHEAYRHCKTLAEARPLNTSTTHLSEVSL